MSPDGPNVPDDCSDQGKTPQSFGLCGTLAVDYLRESGRPHDKRRPMYWIVETSGCRERRGGSCGQGEGKTTSGGSSRVKGTRRTCGNQKRSPGQGKAQGGRQPPHGHIVQHTIGCILRTPSKREQPNRSHRESNPESSDVLCFVVRCLERDGGDDVRALFGRRGAD